MTPAPGPLPVEILAAVEELAAIERPPASAGERRAAELLAGRLGALGLEVRLESSRLHGSYWWPALLTSAAGAAGAALGARRPLLGAALAGAAAATAADDLELGRRPLRRLLPQGESVNVVAQAGPSDAERTLVLHAHHDAAHTGLIFHPGLAKAAVRHAGGLIERIGSTPPAMAGAVAGPALAAAGSLAHRDRTRRLGGLIILGYAAAMADVAARGPVPGANDNLSGVAALLAVAGALAETPPRRTRVILLSTGAEEAFLSGMAAFARRHFPALPRERTAFLCLESVGSPQLMLLDGEGLLRLRRYPDGPRRALAELAGRLGIALRPPFRYRFATDGQVPLRAGYPTAVLSSMDWYKAPSNYHWPSDRPERLDLDSVAAAARLAEGWVRKIDGAG